MDTYFFIYFLLQIKEVIFLKKKFEENNFILYYKFNVTLISKNVINILISLFNDILILRVKLRTEILKETEYFRT